MLGNIYEDACCLALKFHKLSASSVRRSANGVVHSLAQFAKFVSEEHVWLEEQPHSALEALYLDSSVTD